MLQFKRGAQARQALVRRGHNLVEQLLYGAAVMDEAHRLSGAEGAVLEVRLEQGFAPHLAADDRQHLLEGRSSGFHLEDLVRARALHDAGGVLNAPLDDHGIGLLRVDQVLLVQRMRRALVADDEPRRHLHAVGAHRQGGNEAFAVHDARGKDDWDVFDHLSRALQDDIPADVVVARMTAALEAGHGDDIGADLFRFHGGTGQRGPCASRSRRGCG